MTTSNTDDEEDGRGDVGAGEAGVDTPGDTNINTSMNSDVSATTSSGVSCSSVETDNDDETKGDDHVITGLNQLDIVCTIGKYIFMDLNFSPHAVL